MWFTFLLTYHYIHSDNIICPSGKYSINVSNEYTLCQDCPIGYFSKKNADVCFECPNGKVQPFKGKSFCYTCLQGKYAYHEPDSYISLCVRCPFGRYNSKHKGEKCKQCPYGKWSSHDRRKCFFRLNKTWL